MAEDAADRAGSRAPGLWRTLLVAYLKDTRLEWRSPGALIAPPFFALVLATLYAYALQPEVFRELRNLNGVLLATLFFTSAFISARNIQSEKEDGALRVILGSPSDPAGLYLGKTFALWQLQAAFALFYAPLYHLLLRGRPPAWSELGPAFAFLPAAALSLSAVGVLLSYVAAGNRLREMLLPLLLFPVAVPILLLAGEGLAAPVSEKSFPWANLIVLLAPAVLFMSLGSVLYAYLVSDE